MVRLILGAALLAGVIWIGYRFWRRFKRSACAALKQPSVSSAELLVACAHCGTLIPQREAVRIKDQFYCPEHARKAAAQSE